MTRPLLHSAGIPVPVFQELPYLELLDNEGEYQKESDDEYFDFVRE